MDLPLFLYHSLLAKWIICDRSCNFSCDIPSIFVCKIKEFVHEKVYDYHSRKVFRLLMDYRKDFRLPMDYTTITCLAIKIFMAPKIYIYTWIPVSLISKVLNGSSKKRKKKLRVLEGFTFFFFNIYLLLFFFILFIPNSFFEDKCTSISLRNLHA